MNNQQINNYWKLCAIVLFIALISEWIYFLNFDKKDTEISLNDFNISSEDLNSIIHTAGSLNKTMVAICNMETKKCTFGKINSLGG